MMKAIIPTRSLGLLMFIGFLDLITTAWLHEAGLIVELNPLMKGIIEHSEWSFAFVKGLTLVAAWVAMAHYARRNRLFVRNACLAGSAAYTVVWTLWFFGSM